MNTRFALVALSLSLAAPMALGGVTITPIVLQGDNVPGVGNITSIDSIAVNNSGQWLVEADTDNADTNADSVILKSGVLTYREGQALIAPAGASIDSFDSMRLNSNGNTGWNLFLAGPPTNADSGVFFDATLIFQEGTISGAAQFSPNTPYIGFFEVRMNDSNQLMLVASVDDPAIPTTVDRALVVVNYSPGPGTYTESVVNKEGDVLNGQTEMVTDFGTGPENAAFNNTGDILFSASLTGAIATNGALYINSTLLAQKGGMSPIAGRTYTSIGTSTVLDMNSAMDYVFKVTLSGDTATDTALINNGSVFKQEGDTPPGIAGEMLTSFGTGPVRIDNQGNVVWFGQWTGDANTNQGLYSGKTLLAQKGVTQINGMMLTTIGGSTPTGGITKGFDISPSGRYILFRGVLNTTVKGAFLIDLGALCPADISGDGNVNTADLLAVINNWGPCGGCPADVTGDGVVNTADLLAVINAWGACP